MPFTCNLLYVYKKKVKMAKYSIPEGNKAYPALQKCPLVFDTER